MGPYIWMIKYASVLSDLVEKDSNCRLRSAVLISSRGKFGKGSPVVPRIEANTLLLHRSATVETIHDSNASWAETFV